MVRDGSMVETMSNSKENIVGEGRYLDSHIHSSTAHGPQEQPGTRRLPDSTRWNTDSLGMRLAVDVASGAGTAAMICPLITILDKAIIEKAAKSFPIRQNITSSLKSFITRPHTFVTSTPFLLIYLLYSSTYMTANVIDTITSTMNNTSFGAVSAGPAKFLATTSVNLSLCVFKDSRFARIFGAQGNPSAASSSSSTTKSHRPASSIPKQLPIPKTSYGLFCFRDCMTIFASFNLPTILSPHVPDLLASTPASKTALVQFSVPAFVQLFSTPIHLLGLDLYNRQPAGGLPAADRWTRVKRDWAPSCAARILRIVPAYGFAGVVNTRFRTKLMNSLESDEG